MASRRANARQTRERRRQRLVITIAGAAVGIAVLAIAIGILFDQVITPSQPVAQVNTTALSRRDYWTERRLQLARDVNNNLQLLFRFGGQFADQFRGQTPQIDAQVATIRSSAVDDATVSNWIDRTLIEQGATRLSVQASDAEVAQLLATDLNQAFPAPIIPETTSGTGTLTATTTAATAEPAATASGALSDTAALSEETQLEPTPTIQPTLAPENAPQEAEAVLNRLYDAYSSEILNYGQRPALSLDDFRQALNTQYRRQVLTDKIQAQLVPDASFTASEEPTSYETSQILVKVEVPETASDADRQAAFDERRAAAEAILARVRGGEDFATVAQETSDDLSTRDSGGVLTPFDATGKTNDDTQIDPAFLAATVALQEGAISDLVQTPFGWHIIKLDRRVVPSTEDQIQEARTKAFDTWLTEQRAAANVQRFPPVEPTPAPLPTSATEPTVPLPTAPLGGVPTPITDTTGLTDTSTLTDTGALGTSTPAATSAATTAATSAATSAATTAATAASAATTTAATSAATTAATAAATTTP